MAHTETLIEPRPAPQAVGGFSGKLEELRQRGPANGILSFVSYAILALMMWLVLSWAASPTWQATSVAECREIIGDIHGKACWGVINERWGQLLVGFYPQEMIWRPILAFVLMAGSIFFALLRPGNGGVSRKLAIVPFILTPYLLWGGPIWGPAIWVATLALAIIALSRVVRLPIWLRGFLVLAIVLCGGWIVQNLPTLLSASTAELGLSQVTSRQFGGFLLSLLIGLSAIVFSLPLGVVLALGRTSRLPVLHAISTGFIEFIRGVPLIVLLFIASTLLNIFLPPGVNFDIVLRVIIMVTLFASAYIAEVIRGALAAVPKGQTEGAASLGLNYWQTQQLIILPQALKISIPGIVSTFIAVFKDTTLVSIIGLLDPLGLANNIRADNAWTGIVWEIYGFTALIFFIFCFAMSQYSMWLERQLQTDHR